MLFLLAVIGQVCILIGFFNRFPPWCVWNYFSDAFNVRRCVAVDVNRSDRSFFFGKPLKMHSRGIVCNIIIIIWTHRDTNCGLTHLIFIIIFRSFGAVVSQTCVPYLSPRLLMMDCWHHLNFKLSPWQTFDPNRVESLMWTLILSSQPCVIWRGPQGHLLEAGLLLVSDSTEATACHTDWCSSVLASFSTLHIFFFFFPLRCLPSCLSFVTSLIVAGCSPLIDSSHL